MASTIGRCTTTTDDKQNNSRLDLSVCICLARLSMIFTRNADRSVRRLDPMNDGEQTVVCRCRRASTTSEQIRHDESRTMSDNDKNNDDDDDAPAMRQSMVKNKTKTRTRRAQLVVLEEKSSHAAQFILLFDEYLEVLIDDGDGQKNARARPDGAKKIGQDRQGADAQATERGRRRDVSIELVNHRLLAMAVHHPERETRTGETRVGRPSSTHICCSFSCLATSLALEPEISIQVLEKKAHEPSMKTM
jgi:hypothetical protein